MAEDSNGLRLLSPWLNTTKNKNQNRSKKILKPNKKTKRIHEKKTTIMTKKFITKIPHFKKMLRFFLLWSRQVWTCFWPIHRSLRKKSKNISLLFLFFLDEKKHTQNTQYIIRTDRYGGLDFIYYYQVCRLFDHLHLP